MRILNGDNLQILKSLEGERFDLAELDGPYMAGLEGWDILTEAEYIQHYAERLTALRPLLQPWGVVFVFGYPEGCAEIKSWAHRTETLYLRRWLHWYNNRATHQGRFIQIAMMFTLAETSPLLDEFKEWLKNKRESMGLSLREARALTGINAQLLDNPNASSGGYFWYEADCSDIPSLQDYKAIAKHFNTPSRFDILPNLTSWKGLTNIDVLRVPVEKAEQLNDKGLSSKPIKLYANLFQPTIPPTEKRKALVLYGGSGNAAIAAEALGYEVTVIEQDPKRCKLIEKRSSRLVQTWREKLSQGSLWGFPTLPAPDGGDSAPSQALSTPDMFSAIEHESTPAPRR